MQAYMKTDMPFYGVQKPLRMPIARHLVAEFPRGRRPNTRSWSLDSGRCPIARRSIWLWMLPGATAGS